VNRHRMRTVPIRVVEGDLRKIGVSWVSGHIVGPRYKSVS
jgi:hypothetical protein